MTDATNAQYEHAAAPLKTLYGTSTLHCFSFGPHEEDNILAISVAGSGHPPLVRVQSACYTAEIFRSTDCDCHEQLDESLRLVHRDGGLVLYMICDGRGAGLLVKTRALALYHEQDLDTHDAYQLLGSPVDPRSYDRVAIILKALSISSLRLLTNNPRKVEGITAAGLTVEREPLEIVPTADSRPYLQTKAWKFGHWLQSVVDGPDPETDQH